MEEIGFLEREDRNSQIKTGNKEPPDKERNKRKKKKRSKRIAECKEPLVIPKRKHKQMRRLRPEGTREITKMENKYEQIITKTVEFPLEVVVKTGSAVLPMANIGGNSCYINAAVQIIRCTEEVKMRENLKDGNTKRMSQILEELITSEKGTRTGLLIGEILGLGKWDNEPLDAQRDMGEFMISLYKEILDDSNMGSEERIVVNDGELKEKDANRFWSRPVARNLMDSHNKWMEGGRKNGISTVIIGIKDTVVIQIQRFDEGTVEHTNEGKQMRRRRKTHEAMDLEDRIVIEGAGR